MSVPMWIIYLFGLLGVLFMIGTIAATMMVIEMVKEFLGARKG